MPSAEVRSALQDSSAQRCVPGMMPPEPALADAVSRLRRAMRRAGRSRGPGGSLPGGLSVAQLEFVSCLTEHPAARPGEVARMLRIAPSSVATLVNSLTRAGLVVRSGGAADRRTAELELTAAGRQVVTQWQQVNAEILAAALSTMPAASRGRLTAALPALRELTVAVDTLTDLRHSARA